MKNLLVLLIAILTAFGVQAQKAEIADFRIMASYDGETITLKCLEGCEWSELSFNTNDQESMTFTDRGELDDTTLGSRPTGEYIIIVKQEGDRLLFESTKGTAWITTSSGFCEESCEAIIDERGIEPQVKLNWRK